MTTPREPKAWDNSVGQAGAVAAVAALAKAGVREGLTDETVALVAADGAVAALRTQVEALEPAPGNDDLKRGFREGITAVLGLLGGDDA